MNPALAKADDRLALALRVDLQAKSHRKLRVLFVLRQTKLELPARETHATKRAWQHAAAAAQRQAAQAWEPFLEALRSHGMRVAGGAPGRVVTVEGEPLQIIEALESDVVESATLESVGAWT